MFTLKFQNHVLKRELVISCAKYTKSPEVGDDGAINVTYYPTAVSNEYKFEIIGSMYGSRKDSDYWDVCYIENMTGKTIDRIEKTKTQGEESLDPIGKGTIVVRLERDDEDNSLEILTCEKCIKGMDDLGNMVIFIYEKIDSFAYKTRIIGRHPTHESWDRCFISDISGNILRKLSHECTGIKTDKT